jgi:hypothetical protein
MQQNYNKVYTDTWSIDPALLRPWISKTKNIIYYQNKF